MVDTSVRHHYVASLARGLRVNDYTTTYTSHRLVELVRYTPAKAEWLGCYVPFTLADSVSVWDDWRKVCRD